MPPLLFLSRLLQHKSDSCGCRLADIVAGPDAYRDLPRLIQAVQGTSEGTTATAMNVQLSVEETYAGITPTRTAGNVSAFTSIMRGCNNMCSFCIVPYTRGRERSRDVDSILKELEQLSIDGVREVTLLGQNVNSYADFSVVQPSAAPAAADPSAAVGRSDSQDGSAAACSHDASTQHGRRLVNAVAEGVFSSSDPFSVYARGFRSVYKPKRGGALSFAGLLELAAQVDPEMRIRFTSPHPKDFSDEVRGDSRQSPALLPRYFGSLHSLVCGCLLDVCRND